MWDAIVLLWHFRMEYEDRNITAEIQCLSPALRNVLPRYLVFSANMVAFT